jgi:hypothetical protein
MRLLVEELGNNRDQVCKAYARAEKRGEVGRNGNVNNLTPLEYARRLWRDGERRGWLHEPVRQD